MTNATKTERPSNVIDAKTFWRTLGERAIGATIVTAQGADGPAGFLGLSATHVCADPPSMLVSIDRKTSALAAVLHGHHFAINYLGRDARAIADMFAGKTATKGAARFEPGRWGTLTTARRSSMTLSARSIACWRRPSTILLPLSPSAGWSTSSRAAAAIP
jgi:flavin reductase (DIM6/NTAB) family NADH-FMN oxidoreductase RutF